MTCERHLERMPLVRLHTRLAQARSHSQQSSMSLASGTLAQPDLRVQETVSR
jgi:hypothetical protein